MRIKNLLSLTISVILGAGCASTYYDSYGRSEVVVPPATSTRSTVRFIRSERPRPLKPHQRHRRFPQTSGTPDGGAKRNCGRPVSQEVTRNVDIEIVRGAAILRGTVASEYDKHELAGRIGQIPGVTEVDNRLVVAVRRFY
jgi:hypothetical protein